MKEKNTDLSNSEIEQFKSLFAKFCRGEINAGRCKEGCEWCQINKAYDEIFNSFSHQYEVTVVLSKREAELFNRLLAIEPNDTDDAVKIAGYDEDSTIAVITADFGNGYFADIKLCSGQSNFFGDAVLFNDLGYEECVLDCFDSISDGDIFEFKSGSDTYEVTISVVE